MLFGVPIARVQASSSSGRARRCGGGYLRNPTKSHPTMARIKASSTLSSQTGGRCVCVCQARFFSLSISRLFVSKRRVRILTRSSWVHLVATTLDRRHALCSLRATRPCLTPWRACPGPVRASWAWKQLEAGHRLAFKYNIPQTLAMYYPPAWDEMIAGCSPAKALLTCLGLSRLHSLLTHRSVFSQRLRRHGPT